MAWQGRTPLNRRPLQCGNDNSIFGLRRHRLAVTTPNKKMRGTLLGVTAHPLTFNYDISATVPTAEVTVPTTAGPHLLLPTVCPIIVRSVVPNAAYEHWIGIGRIPAVT
jgi:hypothetical protein